MRPPFTAPAIVVASTFPAGPVMDVLRHWADRLQLVQRPTLLPPGQVFQHLLSEAGVIQANREGTLALLVRGSDWSAGSDWRRAAAEFADAVGLVRARVDGPIVIVACPSLEASADDELARLLGARLARVPGTTVHTTRDLARDYAIREWQEASPDSSERAPYSAELFAAAGTAIARAAYQADPGSRPRKVVVVDCDGTLWQGVAGEVGVDGVRTAEAHACLQRALLELRRGGWLLALCSRNDPAVIDEVFRRHQEMPLRLGDFAARRANWQPKWRNIAEIAEELSLGLDSVVFLDDDPFECEAMRAMCPEVVTLDLPDGPAERAARISHLWPLRAASPTREDSLRAEFYRSQPLRESMRLRSGTLRSFISALGLVVDIRPAVGGDLARTSQLTERTSQFNVNPAPLPVEACRRALADEPKTLLVTSARDRFGDYGIVGVVLYALEDGALTVEQFLLSCRALGRGIEYRMIAEVARRACEQPAPSIRVPYRITAKNTPALAFLERLTALAGLEATTGLDRRIQSPGASAAARGPGGQSVEAAGAPRHRPSRGRGHRPGGLRRRPAPNGSFRWQPGGGSARCADRGVEGGPGDRQRRRRRQLVRPVRGLHRQPSPGQHPSCPARPPPPSRGRVRGAHDAGRHGRCRARPSRAREAGLSRFMLVERGRYIFNHGGGQKANKCLLEALVADGHECRAWTVLQGGGGEATEFTCSGVVVHEVVAGRSVRQDLIAAIAAWRPDWVIASQDWSFALLEACKAACPRTIWIDHSPVRLPLGPFLSPQRTRRALAEAAGIVVRSEFHRRSLFAETGLTSFVYQFPVYGGSLPARCGHPQNPHVTIVNPSAIKGIDVFLGLARRLPEVEFAAIPSWATTSADRSALARQPNVRLLERSDDLDRAFATTKVLLVPSRWQEASGQVVIDAMLRGVPVIASDVGGLPEALLGVGCLLPVTQIDRYLDDLDDAGLPVPVLPEPDLGPWEAALRELTSSAERYWEVADASRAAAQCYWEQLSLEPFYRFLEEIEVA